MRAGQIRAGKEAPSGSPPCIRADTGFVGKARCGPLAYLIEPFLLGRLIADPRRRQIGEA